MSLRIMLIDDEPSTLLDLTNALNQDDIEIRCFFPADQGLRRLASEQWDVLICHHQTDATDAMSVCINARQQSPSTYRMLLSSHVHLNVLMKSVRSGAVHRVITAPWDTKIMRRDILEAAQQSRLLSTVHALKSVVTNQQPAIVTDKNWVIRLANNKFCQFINANEQDIFGLNLFAPTLSHSSLTLESEITRQVEQQQTWLGHFVFLSPDRRPLPAQMATATLSEEHHICYCLPITAETIEKQPTQHSEQRPTNRQQHPQQQTETDKPHSTITDNNDTLLIQMERYLKQAPPTPESPDTPPLSTRHSVQVLPSRQQSQPPAMPVFQQQTLAALEAPLAAVLTPNAWKNWLEVMHRSWHNHFSTPLNLIIHHDDTTHHMFECIQKSESLIDGSAHLWVLTDEVRLSGLDTTRCHPILTVSLQVAGAPMHTPGSTNGARTITHLLDMIDRNRHNISGVCLTPDLISYLKNTPRQGHKALEKLRSSNLCLYARQTDSTEALAAAHLYGVDWLSGRALSHSLSADQLRWFAD